MVHQLLSSTPPTLSPVSSHWNAGFDNRRLCYRFPRTSDIAIYMSGGLFAIGWWAFIDAIVYSNHNQSSSFKVSVEEVMCGVVTTVGMLFVALIDKSILSDEFYISTRRTLWQARLLLFLGFTLVAGGLIGSMTMFVIKYMNPHETSREYNDIQFGIAVVFQNVCIMMR
ncbi:7345_t:CDS:2 [Funneliformis geosporum]|uniref:5568_t:CDS:1 n=1 Tax=Funneliformis geosporum TaxID=1117311 RepID=A0A9W4WQA9_9GLOM|nr:7345_t:CDS:2 [Funneliformis geosporum]CAI2170772.1 5568_t:CDS:2 [Funneliformis geosporum]